MLEVRQLWKNPAERINDHQLHIPHTLVLKIKSIIVQAQVVVSQNNTAYFHWQPLGIMLEKKKKKAELMLDNAKKWIFHRYRNSEDNVTT